MTAAREQLHRILKAVIHDLERDGYAREAIASEMLLLGLRGVAGDDTHSVLNLLDGLRNIALRPEDKLPQ
jgi:hypothetical protein